MTWGRHYVRLFVGLVGVSYVVDVHQHHRQWRPHDAWMFWLTWKTLSGSYARLTGASRS